jgi:AraC-like DNA-binding protein
MTETARAVQVATIVQILRENGVDPVPLMRQCGFAPDAGSDPEALVPLEDTLALALLAQRSLGIPHFGLTVGKRVAASGFEALMAPAAACPDVRSAIHVLAEVLRRYRRGILAAVTEHGGMAVVELRVSTKVPERTRLLADVAMTMLAEALRRFVGPRLSFAEVRFAYARPADVRRHSRFFAAPLAFDAEHAALVLESAWLDSKIDHRRPQIRTLLAAWPPMDAPPRGGFVDEVAHVVRSFAGGGTGVTQAEVARRLGMGVRAMHRRLAAEGTGFHALRNRLRHERACYLLSMTAMSMAQIAQALDYSEASAFTRAFSGAAGCAPSEWRRRQRAAMAGAA